MKFLKVFYGNFKGGFKNGSEVFQGNTEFLRMFRGCLFLTVCFKGVPMYSKEVLREFQGNFNGVLRMFQG